jgi:site-specific recombinase XerD
MSIRKRGKKYWYRFTWKGDVIEESTGQSNKEVARQMEAAHRTALAKGEVGIRERKPTTTLAEFAKRNFLPHVRTTFAAKPKTREYYENGVRNLLAFERLANRNLDGDELTNERIAEYVASRQAVKRKHGRHLQIATLNRELMVLRRMFHLAEEWDKVTGRPLPKVRLLPGEHRRDRVLTPAEEALYFAAARSTVMNKYSDPGLLTDVDTILIDCALRPEECFRLQPKNLVEGGFEIKHGKTAKARRRIPMTPRVKAILEVRLGLSAGSRWIFPASTQSGHIEKSTLRKPHATTLREATRMLREQTGLKTAAVESFKLYDLRHTCLTRWAPHMDPWTLMYLAGHADMATTKRYIHPQDAPTQEAMKRAREATQRRAEGTLQQARKFIEVSQGGDNSGDNAETGLMTDTINGAVN